MDQLTDLNKTLKGILILACHSDTGIPNLHKANMEAARTTSDKRGFLKTCMVADLLEELLSKT
jgi:hypothetical protein